jgi:hypothetical protein
MSKVGLADQEESQETVEREVTALTPECLARPQQI